MKILIIYASAGSGHKRAAQALYKAISKENNLQVEIVDSLDYTNIIFRFIYSRGYIFLISYLPKVWGLLFSLTSTRILNRLISYPRVIFNSLNATRLRNLLVKKNPDVVISTHFLPTQISSRLKQRKKINSKIISIITDFYVHPFWISGQVDSYTVGLPMTKGDLIAQGVSKDKIKDFGIPVDPDFIGLQNRQILYKKLSIDKDAFTLLILTGTIGIGPLREVVRLLKDTVQIIVICGRNERLFRNLKKKESRNLRVFGLVDNIQEFMAVSDLLITKPGGLTISEALVSRLPMFFLSLVPGQEEHNARILSSYKAAKIINSLDKLKQLISRYKDSKEELLKMQQEIEVIRRPNSVNDIINLIKKL